MSDKPPTRQNILTETKKVLHQLEYYMVANWMPFLSWIEFIQLREISIDQITDPNADTYMQLKVYLGLKRLEKKFHEKMMKDLEEL